MSDFRRSEIVTGLFVALAAMVFALFAFKVGRFDLMGLLKSKAVTARTYFSNVKTLQVGSKVRVGGREVGEVTSLRLVEGSTAEAADGGALNRLVNEVTLELTYPELRLDPKTARVLLAQDSVLAPHYLELDPGRWSAERTPPVIFEAELPADLVIASAESVGIEEILALAQPVVDQLGAMLRTLNQELLTPENVATVRRAIGELDGALTAGHELATTLNRDLLGPDNVRALERTIRNLDRAVADGRQVTERLEAILDPEKDPRLDRFLTEVASATGELRENLDLVSLDLRHLLHNADRVVGDTEAELAEATRRLHRALWQGELALRKIRANPAVLLFGDDESDLEARDLDLTEIRLRGRARPYEQRDERDDP